MPVISVRIPQLGEGLQEALLVEFLKKPGDQIKRDEPIYVMETDKATTDVESPYSGTLVEWTAQPGAVLEIGTEVAKMEVAEGTKEMAAGHGPDSSAATSSSSKQVPATAGSGSSSKPAKRGDVVIPPKTRKYLKELNLLEVADQIPCAGSKLMPEDVDAYLATRQPTEQVDSSLYNLVPLPQSQVVLNYRLGRATKVTVPVTVMTDINWSAVQQAREQAKAAGGPTGFAMACWAVVQAMIEHDKFRSTLTADGNQLKVFHNVNLGVAVALPGDEMVTAVVRDANRMTPAEFFQAFETQVLQARDGQDQADEATTVTVSNIGKAGMRMGIPAIVAPAVGTLAIGEVFQHPVPAGDSFKFQPTVTATLSFDHRIANGVGAANFLNSVKSRVESFLWQ
jgi:pyruvate/2-oxoglutarate dehydrogenase complex dihydrolipoamide acyltransferase (E2) component